MHFVNVVENIRIVWEVDKLVWGNLITLKMCIEGN